LASKIKNAIREFLSGFSKLDKIDATEITDEVKESSKSKTPERSINVALNALWKKGIVDKYYLKDGDIKEYPTDEKVSREYERLYRIREKEYVRKLISFDEYIFCGQGKERKEKTEVRIKMWTFEDNNDSQEDFLKGELLEYIQGKYGRCYYNKHADMYIDEIGEFDVNDYAYDHGQPVTNPDVIYPETDMVEE